MECHESQTNHISMFKDQGTASENLYLNDNAFLFVYFEKGSQYIVMSGLSLAMQSKLTSDSQRSNCFCFLSPGIKGESHSEKLNSFYKEMISEEYFHQTRLIPLPISSCLGYYH